MVLFCSSFILTLIQGIYSNKKIIKNKRLFYSNTYQNTSLQLTDSFLIFLFPSIQKQFTEDCRASNIGAISSIDSSNVSIFKSNINHIFNSSLSKKTMESISKQYFEKYSCYHVSGEIVFGVSPVLSVLESHRRNIYRLLIVNSMIAKNIRISAALKCAKSLAKELDIQVLLVSRYDLNMYTGNRPHQGLALDCSPLDFDTIDEPPVPKLTRTNYNQYPIWLVLDEVTNVQNFGAIIRSAFFFGVDGVIVGSKKTAPINAFSSKASAGAIEYVKINYVTNIPNFLQRCSKAGWSVLGGDKSSGAVRVTDQIYDRVPYYACSRK